MKTKYLLLSFPALLFSSASAYASAVSDGGTDVDNLEVAAPAAAITTSDAEPQTVTTTKTTTTTDADGTVQTVTVTTIDNNNSDKPKFKLSPRGRRLLDGAVFSPDRDGFSAGVAMPDIRLGIKGSYGKWSAIVEVGFGFGKLSLKDIYAQYTFNEKHLLRAGYFVHQFGLNAATSASMKPTMLPVTSDVFFAGTNRTLGFQYIFDQSKWFVGVSAVAAGNNMTKKANEQGKISVAAFNRSVYRPLHSDGSIAQVGVSVWYQSAMHKKITGDDGKTYTSPGYFDLSANFPTEVDQVSMLHAEVNNARGMFKLSPEWLFAKGRIALEGQYYYMNINREKHLPAYTANGVFALLRGILIGKDYGYSHGEAATAKPGPKSLELVLGYNYTNANCSTAGINGGISSDYSATFTYYINKYLLARLRYSYTNVHNSAVMYDRHVNAIQARIQVIF